MATESYGRCDNGVHWIIYHELPLGQWWWMIHPDGGERIDSPRRYPTEGQALAAVEAARAAVVAGRPVVKAESNGAASLWADLWAVYMRENRALRARAEALEGALAQARAEGEATGYRRAIDEACAAIVALYADEGASVYKSERAHGRWAGLESAEQAVRALAPVEPVSKADGLPGGAA